MSTEGQEGPKKETEKASAPTLTFKEKGINKPTPFDGNRRSIENFIQECRMYLQVNRGVYTTDEDKVIFILSYMNDKEALRWKQTYLRSIENNEGLLVFPTIKDFITNLSTYFKPANMAQDATHHLNQLQQGRKDRKSVV